MRESATWSDEKLFEGYENGKHRRYTLLFSVNGGAFAVVKFLIDQETASTRPLTLDQIAWGMVFFTAIMCFDILMFGVKMRLAWGEVRPEKPSMWSLKGVFAWPGWLVLGTIWLLISRGWCLVISG